MPVGSCRSRGVRKLECGEIVPRLSEYTTLRLGGPADRWIDTYCEKDLIEAVQTAERLFVLGHGSNIVVADSGFRGTVVKVGSEGVRLSGDGSRVLVSAQAGVEWDQLVAETVAEGLSGLECLSGIPGSVGAAPCQNIGAYGEQLDRHAKAVRVFDRRTDTIRKLSADDCGFSYRNSRFKADPSRFVILELELELQRGSTSEPVRHRELAEALDIDLAERASPEEIRSAVIELRRRKKMVIDESDHDTWSTGSFFLNPHLDSAAYSRLARRVKEHCRSRGEQEPEWLAERGTKAPAAWLVEASGFSKGYGSPTGIAISSRHVQALTNRGGGSTDELVGLARVIASEVERVWKVRLEPEPIFVGHCWS